MYLRLIIDEIIKESGLKNEYIARKVGVSVRTLYKWRKNETIPRLDQAIKLANLLDCKVNDLYVYK